MSATCPVSCSVCRVSGRDAIVVEDSSLVRKRKCCLVESIVSLVGGRRAKTSVVGQGDGQQQYYLKLLKSLIARLRESVQIYCFK